MGSDLTPRLDPDSARSWASAAAGRLQNIDSERLLSALLDRQADLPRDLLEQISSAPYYDPLRVEACHAHRKTRPLYLALADRWHLIGERDRAVEVIASVRRQMIDARQSADLVAQLDEVDARLSGEPETKAPAESRWPKWLGFVGTAAQAVFTVLMGLAGLGFLVGLVRRGVQLALAGREHLPLIFVVAVIVVVLYFTRRLIGPTVTAVLKPTLVLSVAGKGVRAARWNYVPGLPRLLDWTTTSAGEFGMPGSDPYMEEGARLSALTDRLHPRMPVGLVGHIAYELLIEPSLQSVPWEALAHNGLAGPKGEIAEQFQFFRTTFNVPGHTMRRSWHADNSVAVVGRDRDTTTLHQLWSRHIDPNRLTTFDERTSASVELKRPVRALHLVGRTRKGSGAQLFQVTAEGYRAAGDLHPDLAHVVIVQCRPQESFDRTQTDREQTAALRGFAADVFEAGAEVVVFLPIMPSTIAERAVNSLAGFCMQRRAPSRAAWLNQVSRLRTIILRSASRAETRSSEAAQRYQHSENAANTEVISDEELASATREIAMDVTLWLRDSGVPIKSRDDMLVLRHFA